MKLTLKKKRLLKKLLLMPESGMGYQVIDIILKDGRVITKVMVYNAEIVELPTEYNDVSEDDIKDIKKAE